MIDHVAFEVEDLKAMAAFYDAVFFALGARRVLSNEQAIAYGVTHPQFWLVSRGRDRGVNYGHVALCASGRVAVDGAHRAGLAHGGIDDGAPGPRPQYGARYYAAYLRDPEGFRVEIVAR